MQTTPSAFLEDDPLAGLKKLLARIKFEANRDLGAASRMAKDGFKMLQSTPQSAPVRIALVNVCEAQLDVAKAAEKRALDCLQATDEAEQLLEKGQKSRGKAALEYLLTKLDEKADEQLSVKLSRALLAYTRVRRHN